MALKQKLSPLDGAPGQHAYEIPGCAQTKRKPDRPKREATASFLFCITAYFVIKLGYKYLIPKSEL